jgi:integrase
LAAPAHDSWLAQHRDNPSEQTFWRTDLAERLWIPRTFDPNAKRADLLQAYLSPNRQRLEDMERWCLQLADECLAARGLVVDDHSRLRLAKAMGAAVQRANLALARFAQGDFSSAAPPGTPSTMLTMSAPVRAAESPLPFDTVIQGWAAERRPTEKTPNEWRRVMQDFATFVGHNDARQLTPDDLVRWKRSLVDAGRRPKAIRDAKLAPVRSILQWAVDNRLLHANPAERISIEVKTRAAETRRAFDDEEAAIVLKAALAARDPVRRWVPWLCAYSGARLSEVCQLRREDIVCLEGIWVMRIAPEAGSLKTRSAEREVPLHPAVLASGFLVFVEKAKPGPLFPSLPPDRFGSRGGNGTKILGRWVRGLGLNAPRLSPNHSWRHRLKTLGRRYALAPDIVSAIVGHARKTVADSYGDFPIEALHRELCKIPAVQLPPD